MDVALWVDQRRDTRGFGMNGTVVKRGSEEGGFYFSKPHGGW